MNKTKNYCVYVVELDKKVLNKKKFIKVNENYKKDKPCVYVGMTFHSPDKRFEHHKNRHKSKKGYDTSSFFPREFGIRLIDNLCEPEKSLTFDEAKELEIERARDLREKGYGVWQN